MVFPATEAANSIHGGLYAYYPGGKAKGPHEAETTMSIFPTHLQHQWKKEYSVEGLWLRRGRTQPFRMGAIVYTNRLGTFLEVLRFENHGIQRWKL